jgi:hypothetical protein
VKGIGWGSVMRKMTPPWITSGDPTLPFQGKEKRVPSSSSSPLTACAITADRMVMGSMRSGFRRTG